MATVSATSIKFGSLLTRTHRNNQLTGRFSSVRFVSASTPMNGFPSLKASRLTISCKAKPETVKKVCEIVIKQLALPPNSDLTPESKFSALGADSLDTVEIVMALEEEFGITVEEENSTTITTIQEASDLIEKLVEKKDG